MTAAMPDRDLSRIWPGTLAALVLDALAVTSFLIGAFLPAPSSDLDYVAYWALAGVLPAGLSFVAVFLTMRSLVLAPSLGSRLVPGVVAFISIALLLGSGAFLLLLSQGTP